MVEGADSLTEFVMDAINNSYDNGYPTAGLTAMELAEEIVEKTGGCGWKVQQIELEIDRIRCILCIG